jgi:hypothetical protein
VIWITESAKPLRASDHLPFEGFTPRCGIAMAYRVRPYRVSGADGVEMEGRLLPIVAWYWGLRKHRLQGPVPSEHKMPWRNGEVFMFVLWLFGVPALAGGLAFDAVSFVSAAGAC